MSSYLFALCYMHGTEPFFNTRGCVHVKLNSVHYTMCTINMFFIRCIGINAN